ncbi:hypothetical protein OVA11_06055 [Caulobacter sp. SL161]|uniref:nSTAND3 domain-containing NTPase n=1 Tax=Caulobacter sp. SL161 TaxID=2995156 RepID=UPI0022726810|nr:hypothetical protein [Caulobacter sp. SL161]MCY1646652.1 hypothetical protein [Caulobacter sp. SL161]
MTIARFAQDKFEYQDLATLFFALAGLNDTGLEIRPEPSVGEDTEVRTLLDGRGVTIDIQAKDEKADVDLARLAYHLAHPTAHRTDETLLDRLHADPDKLAVFITSGRLRDDAALYAAPEQWAGRTLVAASPTQDDARDFLTAFSSVALPTTSYEPARQAHRRSLSTRLSAKDTQKVLRRVLVLERVSNAALRQRCVEIVARWIRAPETIADRLIDDLFDLVRSAKKSGADIVPPLRALLARHRRAEFGSADYEPHGLEQQWVDTLRSQGLLLIGGPPRCGKTEVAEHLADRFMDLGYDVVRAADVADARRLLRDQGAGQRLVFLDDPLGDGWSIADIPNAYDGLRRLVSQTSTSRLLLVAQNQTPLLNAANQESLATVRTGPHAWTSLARSDGDLALRVWRRKAAEAAAPAEAAGRIAAAIEAGKVQLELGALQHLAYCGRILESSTVEDMLALADEDAMAFGQRVSEDAMAGAVLAAIGMATDPTTGLDAETLAFIISGDPTAAPSLLSEKEFRGFSMGTDAHEDGNPPPVYAPAPVLSAEPAEKVEALENSRVLVRDPVGDLQLAHGFYRAAALSVLRRPSPSTAKRHLQILRRGLFCLSPRVSRACARNLGRIAAALPASADHDLVEIAASGLSSLFPGTRDLCWRYLIGRFDTLSPTAKVRLPLWLQNAYSTDLDDIVWRNGEAWLYTGMRTFGADRLFRRAKLEDVRDDLEGLEGADEFILSPERADQVLVYYDQEPSRLNEQAMNRLLSYDEAALRAEGSRIWLLGQRSDDHEILDRIFEERHPRIAVEILKGVAWAWPDLSDNRKADLVARLKAFVASPAVALPLLDRLVVFNRVEHFTDDPPWVLFAALLPVVLEQMTDSATGAEPRLFAAAEDAVRALPPQQVVPMCEAWIGWLTRTSREQLRSDHAWGVIDILITATRAQPDLRDGLLAPLFSRVTETGAAVMLLREVLGNWEHLTEEERRETTRLLDRDRKDRWWLKAVALTHPSRPPELEISILGASLAATAPEPEAQLSPELLHACLEVYLGVEPFGSLGLGQRDRAPWSAIALRLAATPDHPESWLCLESLVRREDEGNLLAVLPHWGRRLDDILELLIQRRLATAGDDSLVDVWRWVFDAGTDAQRQAWDSILSEKVAGVIDSASELGEELGLDFEEIPLTLEALEGDFQMMVWALDVAKITPRPPGLFAEALDHIVALVERKPPRLFKSFDLVTRVLRVPETRDHPAWDVLSSARHACFKPRDKIRRTRTDSWVVDRATWNGPM